MPLKLFITLRRILSSAAMLAALAPAYAQEPATAGGSGAPAVVLGDPNAGKAAYALCMACHALDENGIGPKHRGLVGRKAGTVAGYKYSPALLKSDLTWTPQTLDRWLQDPRAVLEDTRMFFSVTDAKERADIIAYLATEK
jgi:cytochrome c